MAEVIVKQDENNVIPAEVLATSISKISDSLAAWKRGGMRRETLVILLSESTRFSKTTVRSVLDGIDKLQDTYCLPKPIPTQPKKK